jgi:putative ATP-dependent endonuclease of OLD family
MTSVVRYQYEEKGEYIPEGQFGLGYTNLMHIIGELIDFVESYPQNDSFSKLNIVSIEEPESFMHPEMQANFIKYIDDAVTFLLNQHSDKHINVQLIITTHSSHILNSKIHSANSFDNINYINDFNGQSQVVRLSDKAIMPQATGSKTSEHKQAKDDLSYLKKHIKYKVSELFFCDAIILVEGATEETLLPFFKDQDKQLNKKYIPVFNIGGAHGLVYHQLLRLLGVPALIITDIDIDRSEEEKTSFAQLTSLKDRQSTNPTIKHYAKKAACRAEDDNANDAINLEAIDYFSEDNLHIVFQKEQVNGYHATSFEEALILQNHENKLLNTALETVKPKVYADIVGEEKELVQLCHQSFKLQKKLSGSKGNFANELLYQLTTQEVKAHPELPEYLLQGFAWLKSELNPELNTSPVEAKA